MTHTQTITPKKRINSIDALRGFALIGIMLLHCMERFDLTLAPVVEVSFLAGNRYGSIRFTLFFVFREIIRYVFPFVRFELFHADGVSGS